MEIIFTTCTYNHISRAFSLGASIEKYAPQYHFIICVVDQIKDDLDIPVACEVTSVSSFDIPFFDELIFKYSALELNSALKPYLAYSILESKQPSKVIYLDSDIILYNSFDYLNEKLEYHSIVLTPHSWSSISGDKGVDDTKFTRSGIFNAGFFLAKNDSNALAFLDWWRLKLKDQCYIDSNKGMFGDQLWLNLAPIYFDFVYKDQNLGSNVAYWNLHERHISQVSGRYFVNDEIPLIFFHFSGVSDDALEINSVSTHQKQYNFDNRPDVRPLYEEYVRLLKQFGHGSNEAYYTISKNLKTKNKIIIFAVTNYKKILKRLFFSR